MKAKADSKSSFHTALARVRVESGITQVELARRSGVSQPRIATLEAGAARPSKQTAERIARGLGVAVEVAFPNFSGLRDANRVAGVRTLVQHWQHRFRDFWTRRTRASFWRCHRRNSKHCDCKGRCQSSDYRGRQSVIVAKTSNNSSSAPASRRFGRRNERVAHPRVCVLARADRALRACTVLEIHPGLASLGSTGTHRDRTATTGDVPMTPARQIRCGICRDQTDAITSKDFAGLLACPKCAKDGERRKKYLTPKDDPPWIGELCEFVGFMSRNLHWLALPTMRKHMLMIFVRIANEITTDLLRPPPPRR